MQTASISTPKRPWRASISPVRHSKKRLKACLPRMSSIIKRADIISRIPCLNSGCGGCHRTGQRELYEELMGTPVKQATRFMGQPNETLQSRKSLGFVTPGRQTGKAKEKRRVYLPQTRKADVNPEGKAPLAKGDDNLSSRQVAG